MIAPTLKKALGVEGGVGRLTELKARRRGRWSGAVVDAPQPRNELTFPVSARRGLH